MNIEDTRLTLDGYRIQVLEKLKACADAAQARDILAEVQTVLAAARMSDSGQKAFWQSLSHDLNVLAHELSRPPDNPISAARRALLAAAQAAIGQYQRQLKSDR